MAVAVMDVNNMKGILKRVCRRRRDNDGGGVVEDSSPWISSIPADVDVTALYKGDRGGGDVSIIEHAGITGNDKKAACNGVAETAIKESWSTKP